MSEKNMISIEKKILHIKELLGDKDPNEILGEVFLYIKELEIDKERLQNEIARTTTVVRQYLDNPELETTKGILENCCKANEELIEKGFNYAQTTRTS